MRFDCKELARLAQAPSAKFVKEGTLWLKNKQDGLFKKEVYTERWCRLRGNLLFYFKTCDQTSEPVGLLVIERASVQLEICEESDFLFLFSIVFEGEDRTYMFACDCDRERDTWIQSLHVASYECMKLQVDSLCDLIRCKTGVDPLRAGQQCSNDTTATRSRHSSISADCSVEVCLACTNLPLDSTEQPPNAMVIVNILSPQRNWQQMSQTEIIERCTDPQFLTTIGFGDAHGLDSGMKVQLVVYDVKEMMTGTMTEIGQVIFSVADILRAAENKLHLRLNSQENINAGYIAVMSWTKDYMTPPGLKTRRKSLIRNKPNRLDMLKCVCENVYIKSFRFDTLHGHGLCVYEYLAESLHCFHIPCQLLQLWIEQEKMLIDNLQDLGELRTEWSALRQSCLHLHMATVGVYSTRIHMIETHAGPNFKPSIKKCEKDFEFIPTNLQLQRMTVDNEETGECGGYDTVTCGAFTAAPHKYKDGGLNRLLKTVLNSHTMHLSADETSKITRSGELLDTIKTMQSRACETCDRLIEAVRCTDKRPEILTILASLQRDVRQLIGQFDDPILEDSYKLYLSASADNPTPVAPPRSRHRSNSPMNPDLLTDSVKIANVEPWELSCINTDAALVCVQTMTNDLLSQERLPREQATSDLHLNIVKLKSFLVMLVKRAVCALTFLSLAKRRESIPLLHTIKYRRDVVFSQAVTALTTAFVTKVRTSINNDRFMRQVSSVGVLAQFECLLTCHGEELGMMEDMSVGVADLKSVTFRLIPALNNQHRLPDVESNISGFDGYMMNANRTSVTVNVPLPPTMFNLLPQCLKQGQLINVVPVYFNIGINEQVILAERLGDMSFQETINIQATNDLLSYCSQCKDFIENPGTGQQNAASIDNLSKQLQYNVTTKRSKNVEILHAASEICRKLDGLHFVSCKSGKDRTGMAVTLEQVQLLQKHYSLASHVFMHALDCFRSEGVRRENTLKNVGVRKYAFTSLQLPLMPKLYRPPNGTYGNFLT